MSYSPLKIVQKRTTFFINLLFFLPSQETNTKEKKKREGEGEGEEERERGRGRGRGKERGRGRVSNLGGNMIGKGSSGSCALLNSTLGCVSKHKETQW